MRKFIIALSALALVATAPVAASAHALLRSASPAVGAHGVASVDRIVLQFSEPVEASLSKISLETNGAAVALGAPTTEGDGRVLSAAVLSPLKAGTYRVRWRAVSVDTHTTEGDFTFTIGQ